MQSKTEVRRLGKGLYMVIFSTPRFVLAKSKRQALHKAIKRAYSEGQFKTL